MGSLLENVINVIIPVAICVGIGCGLGRFGAAFDRKLIGALVQNVGYPALIISHLSSAKVDLGAFAVMIGAALAMQASFVLIGGAALLALRLPLRAFISPMSLNNVGNIGLPVASLALGSAGLSYSFAFLLVVLLGIFTYGTWVPRGTVTLRHIVTSPVLYAIAAALILLGTGTALPKPLAEAFDILGGLAIPLMLLTLGHSLATLTVSSLRRGAVLAVIHIVMAAGVGFGLAALFGFTGVERQVFILMSLMPVSVATYLFVELYASEHASDVAGLILVSTSLTVVVLPVALTIIGT